MKTKKWIASLLTTTLILSSVFANGVANAAPKHDPIDFTKSENKIVEQETTKAYPKRTKTRQEIENKRSEYSKTYLEPDGTFTAEIYQDPVYWKDSSGKWQDINNTLVESSDENFAIENKSNKFKTKFSKDAGTSRIELGGNFIEFVPQSTIAKKEHKKEGNKASYEGLYKDVVIEKVATASGMKENIVLHSKKAQTEFTYEVKTSGLTAQKEKDGSISFLDKNRVFVFAIEKPFAYDARGVMTDEVTLSIVEKNKKTYLVQKLSDAWFQDEQTQLPVVVDPTVVYNKDNAIIQDAPIFTCFPTNNYDTWNLPIGAYPTVAGCEVQSLIKFNLPNLQAGQIIDSASLKINTYTTTTTPTNVQVYQLATNWDPKTVTWNTKPTRGGTAFDTKQVVNGSTNNGVIDLNVKVPVTNWYRGVDANYGVLLKAQNPSDEYKVFYRADGAGADLAPRLTIKYHLDALGLESFWGYDNSVNLLSGNYVESATDVSLDGKGIPISVSRTYNSRSTVAGSLGYGWMMDADMKINSVDPLNSKIAQLTDPDGTVHAFTYHAATSTWTPPPGIYYDLVYNSAAPANFVLTDKSQTKYTFDAATGRLTQIKDNNGLTTAYSYDGSGRLQKITDPSSRFVTFTYDANNRVDTIVGSQIPTVKYTYSATGDLAQVDHKDASGNVLTTVKYEYDTFHNLTKITDKRENSSLITYDTAKDQVTKFTQTVTNNGTPKDLDIAYVYGEYADSIGNVTPYTIKTNAKGIQTKYSMDSYGHILKIEDDFGNPDPTKIITNEFTWDANSLVTQVKDARSKTTLLSYDDSGNLLQTTDPSSQSEIMKYNSNDQLIQKTNGTSVSSGASYDGNQNVSDSTDGTGSSITYRYDDSGNVIESTQSISLDENLVANSGFEAGYTGSSPKQVPTKWTLENPSTTGSHYLLATHVNGSYSFGLVSPNATNKVTFASEYIPVTAGIAYNTSYSVSTLTSIDKANVYLRWYNSAKTVIKSDIIGVTTGQVGWTRKWEQAEAPANAAYAKVAIEAVNGTAAFDNIQLQEGWLSNESSTLVNDDFELDANKDGLPDSWIFSTPESAPTDGIDTTQTVHEEGYGDNTLKISSSSGSKWFGQTVKLSGSKGSQITLSGWSKAQSITAASTVNYDIAMKVSYTDTTTQWFYLPFTNSNHDWEYKERTVTIPKDYKNYIVYARYSSPVGTIWFDDVSAVQTLGNTAMVSRYNMAENGSFEAGTDTTVQAWGVNTSGSGATVSVVNSYEDSYSGDRAMRVTNSTAGGNTFIANPYKETLKANSTYTFSVMAKSVNAPNATAYVKFDIFDAAGNLVSQKYSKTYSSGNADWKRIYVSLSQTEAEALAAGATKIQPVISVANVPSTGQIYIDDARFEEGAIVSKNTYDPSGNYLKSEADPLGNKVSYEVDDRGNVTEIRYPIAGSKTMATYDALDQTKSLENATGLRIEYLRDGNGNVTETKYIKKSDSSLVGSVKQSYNELNELTSVTDQLNRTSTYSFDDVGNISSITYPNGKSAIYTYDNFDRLTSLAFPGESTTFGYTYDKVGNTTSVTKNGTNVTSYGIDSNLNRVNSVTYPNVNGVRNTTNYAYDAEDKVTSSTDSKTGISTYQYNVAGQSLQYTGPNGQTAKNMYDEAGRLAKQTVINGSQSYFVFYEYNDTGVLKSLRQETSNGAVILADSYSYDILGNMTKIVHKDGSYTLYTYDLSNQLLSETDYSSSGAQTRQIAYTYDGLGNRLSMNRVILEGLTSYNYDEANQLVSVNGETNGFDGNGNLTQDDQFTYTYNTKNQLHTVTDLNGNLFASYEYDHEGKRTKKVTQSKTEMYYYDSDDLSYITDENNVLRFSFGRDADGTLISMTDHTGTTDKTYTYVLNYRGDVIGMYDSSGALVASYTYESYGRILTQSGSGLTGEGEPIHSENPFKYASYFHDKETSYYYLMARYYNPAQGRFLSVDPNPNANLYVYVENDPVNNVDPAGTKFWNFVKRYIGPQSAYYSFKELYGEVKNTIKNPTPSNVFWTSLNFVPYGKVARLAKPVAKYGKKAYSSIASTLKKPAATTVRKCNCFPAGTLVETDQGQVPIEDIQIGDKVLSKDEETGEIAYKEVINTFDHESEQVYKLSVGNQIIETTFNHPFWVEGKGWVLARDLKVGDQLVQSDGDILKIEGIEIANVPTWVYNFTVAEFHTYFVSSLEIWVHNENCGWSPGSYGSSERSLKKHFEKHGEDVGAVDEAQYLRKAQEFKKNLKGASKSKVPGYTQGVTRYKKNGKYIDLDSNGNIVSFGKQ
jgi:RHS repeat-associated protein